MASWSSVLQAIIKSPAERQRLSAALGVSTVTLSRWANGDSRPQRSHLVHLVNSVHANNRQELIDALELQYPEIQAWIKDTPEQIPPHFFAHILHLRTTTTDSQRFWRISEVVLKQALEQLDPNGLGMAVKLVQCMPPATPGGRVRSLRERTGRGTPPWTADLEHDVLFLGLESLSGRTVEERHVQNEADLTARTSRTYVRDDYEMSAAAHPICLEGKVAGCLLASSTQLEFFSQQRLSLLATFSHLLSLALDKQDFYDPRQISLRPMPPPQVQRPILASFRQRVTKNSQKAMHQKLQLTNSQIELQTWQELESELLEMPLPQFE
ncbi:MAG: GAF domain-containing protein [Ktedonobacteraceae bacterium]|nr:GAF domain-containing protein [Ktedonobacteraceae bacterium]MBO0790743.1 GAF domain-containing protein [Ktedonobacteraceae bacterium]